MLNCRREQQSAVLPSGRGSIEVLLIFKPFSFLGFAFCFRVGSIPKNDYNSVVNFGVKGCFE